MILSEYERRWAEIRLYQFCYDVYNIRQQSIDIVDSVNTICDFAGIDAKQLRPVVQVMLRDTYYQASKREIILIGSKMGLAANNIAKYLGTSRQNVNEYIKRNAKLFTPLPRCPIDTDHLIVKFLQTLDKLKDIGSLGYGTINKTTV